MKIVPKMQQPRPYKASVCETRSAFKKGEMRCTRLKSTAMIQSNLKSINYPGPKLIETEIQFVCDS